MKIEVLLTHRMVPVGPDFPFNEERVVPDGVNRNSAVIGGKKFPDSIA